MVNRIDFLGAPGVGKSTLYNALISQNPIQNNWLKPSEAKIMLAQMLSRSQRHSFQNYAISLLLNINLFHKIHPVLSGVVCNKHRTRSLWNDAEDEVALDYFIQANALSPYPSNIRLLRYCWLLEIKQDVALFEQYIPDDFTVLFDESLTQRLISLGPWNSQDEQQNLHKLCGLLGDVSSVVFLDAKDETVIQRVEDRRDVRITRAHSIMNEEDLKSETRKNLKSARQIADMLERKDIPVIRVNAEETIATQIQLIQEDIIQLSRSKNV